MEHVLVLMTYIATIKPSAMINNARNLYLIAPGATMGKPKLNVIELSNVTPQAAHPVKSNASTFPMDANNDPLDNLLFILKLIKVMLIVNAESKLIKTFNSIVITTR